MQNAIDQFRENLRSIRRLDGLCILLEQQGTSADDFSEILRSEIVLIVSALDCFVHDLVRIGMVAIFRDSGTGSKAFSEFSVSMRCLKQILSLSATEDQCGVLANEIRRMNGYKSFQEPDQIAKALSVLGTTRIWEQVARRLSLTASEVKDRLATIVEQRNRIAHEADINPTLGIGKKYFIDRQSTIETVNFVEVVCESLFQLISFPHNCKD